MTGGILSPRRVPKYAWGLVVAGGLFSLVTAVGLLLPGDTIIIFIFFTGNPSNASIYPPQAYSDLVIAGRVAGVFWSIAALMQIAIGLKAFRRGEKWAWYAVHFSSANGPLQLF
jgi:hypothetical protein